MRESWTNDVFGHGAFLNGEAHAHLYNPAAVGGISFGIALALNLAEGVLCRAVDLQFHHIDGVGHEHHHVGPRKRSTGGGEQRLAETARPAEEDILAQLRHLPHQVGLVNIDIAFCDDFRKSLDAYRVFSPLCHDAAFCFRWLR